jgi:S1-C subfamily serine protease
MKCRSWVLSIVACLVVGPTAAAAQRAQTPADATVFIRLVGSVHGELESAGTKQAFDLNRVELGTGSGFVISPHGYVLTNEHVISNSEFTVSDGPRQAKFTLKVASILVCFPAAARAASGDPSRCLDASVHSSDAALDLAVLFISAADLPYVALGDSDAVTSSQPVSALGYPFGRQLEVGRVAAPDLVPDISTSSGTISALRADDRGERRVLQINGTVNPGNSGGPLVDRDGFAVGVIRARVVGDAGIAFAIPINQAKDFLEARGLDSLMPAPRLRLGPLQTIEGKGLALRLPLGVADISSIRARVESDVAAASVVLRIDRTLSSWTAKQVESMLTGTPAFERVTVEASESQVSSRSGRASLLIGRATGTIAGDARSTGMYYGILELNSEKLVARYVGPAEHLAYNEHVLRESLLSLDGQRLAVGDMREVQKPDWSVGVAATADVTLPMPGGWSIEPGAPTMCAGLPDATFGAAAYPPRDFSVALRTRVWNRTTLTPEAAAAACSAGRGLRGAASYSARVEWLGVSYVIEGAFVSPGAGHVVQLEVIAPAAKSAAVPALLAEWIAVVAKR